MGTHHHRMSSVGVQTSCRMRKDSSSVSQGVGAPTGDTLRCAAGQTHACLHDAARFADGHVAAVCPHSAVSTRVHPESAIASTKLGTQPVVSNKWETGSPSTCHGLGDGGRERARPTNPEAKVRAGRGAAGAWASSSRRSLMHGWKQGSTTHVCHAHKTPAQGPPHSYHWHHQALHNTRLTDGHDKPRSG